jgi:hypothetical protein
MPLVERIRAEAAAAGSTPGASIREVMAAHVARHDG